MNIGERIRQRRLELGLSVDEVAKRLGKNRATIYRYENNYIENLPASVLEPLAEILGTTPAFLMGWHNNPSITKEERNMKLYDLLKLYDDGTSSFTILPCCEEYSEGLDNLIIEPWFLKIADREIKRIVTIGGHGGYKVETIIELEEDSEGEMIGQRETLVDEMMTLCTYFHEYCNELAAIPAAFRDELVKKLMSVPSNYMQKTFLETIIKTAYGAEFWEGDHHDTKRTN